MKGINNYPDPSPWNSEMDENNENYLDGELAKEITLY